jgi:hypothetical protein
VGNTLLQDDGVGVHVLAALRTDFHGDYCAPVANRFVDAGTVGLALPPAIEDAATLVVVTPPSSASPRGPSAYSAMARSTACCPASAAPCTKRRWLTCSPRPSCALQPGAKSAGRDPARLHRLGPAPDPNVAAAIPRACAAVDPVASGTPCGVSGLPVKRERKIA